MFKSSKNNSRHDWYILNAFLTTSVDQIIEMCHEKEWLKNE